MNDVTKFSSYREMHRIGGSASRSRLRQVATGLPGGRRGKAVHVSALFRWVQEGKLEAVECGWSRERNGRGVSTSAVVD